MGRDHVTVANPACDMCSICKMARYACSVVWKSG